MVELNEYSSEECSLSSARSGTSSPRFSLFKWFKRSPKPQHNSNPRKIRIAPESVFSSSDSVDTFYSTATVRSFAFQAGRSGPELHTIDLARQDPTKVGPFGDGAVKILERDARNLTLNVTRTLPANVLSRRRDITARYSLQTCTTSFGSCSNISHQRNLSGAVKRTEDRGNIRRVHVRGKRRAPNPPSARPRSLCEVQEIVVVGTGKRKRRPAPKPPEHLVKKRDTGMDGERKNQGTGKIQLFGEPAGRRQPEAKEVQSISTDTLVLRGGVLLPKREAHSSTAAAVGGQSTAMPRPWYKRNVFEHSNVNKETSSSVAPSSAASDPSRSHDEGSLRHFFSRSDRNTRDGKKGVKRQSGLSILTNISELDKEAAAIVQEEQAKSRAAMLLEASRLGEIEKRIDGNEEVVQDMVTSAMENSPRRGTRALISKFNAIGNITKVTVNTSFFAKRDGSKGDQGEDWKRRSRVPEGPRGEKDISKYFRSHQVGDIDEKGRRWSPKLGSDARRAIDASRSAFLTGSAGGSVSQNAEKVGEKKIGSGDAAGAGKYCPTMDVTNRLSALQDIIKKHSSPIPTRSLTSTIGTSQDDENSSGSFSNSPKLLRSRVTEHRDTRTEKFDEVRTSAEVIQREFSQIFEEIDRQLSTSKLRLEQQRLVEGRNFKKSDSSNQVSKVLDILVQTENLRKSEKVEKNDRAKTTIVSSENRVTDLKEMLKEMKHSLPKRPKPKRPDDVRAIPSTSRFQESVKVTAPPVLRMAAPKSPKIEVERQKVSSGVQTSGNIRRIDNLSRKDPPAPGKGSSGVVRKTFHLMRPREFAAIEAIMTMKNSQEENTYANVIEQSIYANAMVLPSRSHRIIPTPTVFGAKKRETSPTPDAHPALQLFNATVNRLLKKLEAAIASGNHQQAAGFAKELAKLKIQCSVVRQKAKVTDVLNVDMFIEDRLAHQGPIPLQLPITMSVGELKYKISQEFQIPPNVQRWIIAKKLADDDDATLQELNAVEGLPVFLYLAAPVLQIDNGAKAAGVAPEDDKMEENEEIDMAPAEESSDEESSDEEAPHPLFPEVVTTNGVTTPGTSDVEEEPQPEVMQEAKKPKYDEVTVEELVSENEKPENPENEANPDDNDEEGAVGIIERSKMEYNELIMLENCGLVQNIIAIECPICLDIYEPLEGVVLRDCLHAFCRACIKDTIKYCSEAEVKCPYGDAVYTCESTLQQREIKALVDADVYEQYLAKSVSQAENNAGQNAFHCKTPDCPGWCIYDENVNNFLCPACDMTNCLTCRVIHDGKNCWEYQEDVRLSSGTDQEATRTAAMLTAMLDSGEAMICPTCAVVLMKKWGCDWLRCSMCKTEICWVTKGPRWGPGGKGDTSGGCRCQENGVKCHPRCNYCH
ncbi:uncharacterized protein LOC107036258 [Diachasma alloeum]|uniref:uncharacterized protein LOC107036258 n=1 Tax=Diachasma alloeum TaxID=454923 RepID=UPI0010FB3C38|nr:uncharacterized protein LOC107036258 [Diachasma alloeum]